MILRDINDYYMNKMFIPICSESLKLNKAVAYYEKLKRTRKVISKSNERDIDNALQDVRNRMENLKQFLIIKNLWG